MRLDRFLSDTTGMSRKEATRALHRSEVSVDGQVVKKGAVHVSEDSCVEWNGVTLTLLGPTYIMFHKPVGCICANDDPSHVTVFSYLDLPNPDKFHTVGRLDLDTSGLLLVTNDGQWSHRITSPKHACEKVYRAQVSEALRDEHVTAFAEGLKLHGDVELTKPAQLDILSENEALVTLTEGRYHQVRRMFAAIGNRVETLHREAIGGVQLDPNLAPGEFRDLTAEEVAQLAR
ncbi:16S rRNA pseudouridine(516) synthase RsuA [Aliidiomarina halalkaliphila]|uniref:Pseudouridine synthase n=1 Tax=Aliidiomarina halalkaliphila TaxID=2593535 RepID=A0A552WZE9_9GAMM|nr:16S rRNA pseudouridine(516) synthase RsuA [Aliidiomarina halalkaliphila]TRW47969.1 16S rRNA pseudouridine(516) synthase RsuA [Aliidiomarina halalkaliphila]